MAEKLSREDVVTLSMRDQNWADLRFSRPTMEHLMKMMTPGVQRAVDEHHEMVTLQLDPEQAAVILQAMAVCVGELVMRDEGLVV